jgi:hypothetical protein
MTIQKFAFLMIPFTALSMGCSNLAALSPTYTLTVMGSGSATATSLNLSRVGSSILAGASSGSPAGSPTSLTVSVSTVYLGTNADCTGLVAQDDYGSTPKNFDLFSTPTLFNGSPDAGSYSCVAIKFGSVVNSEVDSVATAAFGGVCASGTSYATELYPSADSPPWVDVLGKAITPVNTQITFFASVNPDAAKNGALKISARQISTLNGPFTTPGTLTFYIDGSNGIIGTPSCQIGNSIPGFRF